MSTKLEWEEISGQKTSILEERLKKHPTDELHTTKTILVDMDDTITWLLPIWVEELNYRFKENVDWREIKDWDMGLAYPNLTREQIYEPLATEEIWDSVVPRPGAIKYLKELQNKGFDIYICTSTDYRNIVPKYTKVISKYFPFIDWKHVIVANNKQMIKADYIIDDAPHNLVGGCQNHKILIHMPHNENFPAKEKGIKHCGHWKEIYELICEFENLKI